jgi:protein associated with RNAse G/E
MDREPLPGERGTTARQPGHDVRLFADGAATVGAGRPVRVHAVNYDGTDHWQHGALLLRAEGGMLVTGTRSGLEVTSERGIYVSPFDTNGHYWHDRWFNVIRLEEPGRGLSGFYCNIASPVRFDGRTLQYTDLQLDVRVYVQPDGTWTYAVLDEDEFEAARRRYGYSEDLVTRCRSAVEEVIALIEGRLFPFV